MRNRAKCKLCGDIIESLAFADIVSCSCDEITIWGGLQELRTVSRTPDYRNFLRIDESGNEIAVKYVDKDAKEKGDEQPANPPEQIATKEIIDTIEEMIKNDENLPQHVLFAPCTQADLIRYAIPILSVLKRLADSA